MDLSKEGALWHVDAEVALEVAAHEALIRQTYKDSVGVLTWCVGRTNATGHRVERYIGKPQPVQHCMNVYAWALENYADGVRVAFKGVAITKARFAAALSFHWNTGAIKTATWVKHFRAGNIAAACKAIMNWKTPPEIEGRRKKERALFFDGKWSNDGTMTEYTRLGAGRNAGPGAGRDRNPTIADPGGIWSGASAERDALCRPWSRRCPGWRERRRSQ